MIPYGRTGRATGPFRQLMAAEAVSGSLQRMYLSAVASGFPQQGRGTQLFRRGDLLHPPNIRGA